jgi:hypothetical protein
MVIWSRLLVSCVLFAMIGCAKDDVSDKARLAKAEAVAISEVVKRESVSEDELEATGKRKDNSWSVIVVEKSNRQAAFWHVVVSDEGVIQKFTGGE